MDELSSRPALLSPALPRLPGSLAAPTAAEPPLAPEDFAPRPPPIPCAPLPPGVAERLAAGEGLAVGLEGYRRYSQLAWALEQQAAQQAQQAERPARAPGPAAQAPGAASAAVSSNSSSGSEGAACSGGGPHQHSRASAALPAGLQAPAAGEGEQGGPGGEGEEDLEALLEQELAGEGGEAFEARQEQEEQQEEEATAEPQPEQAGAGAAEEAAAPAAAPSAGQEAAQPVAKPQSAAQRRQQRQTGRRQTARQAPAAALPPLPAPAPQLPQPQPQPQQQPLSLPPRQQQQQQPLPGGAADAGASSASGSDSSDQGSGSEGEEGREGGKRHRKRQRKQTLAQQAVAAALAKVGEDSWDAFSAKLRARQAEAADGRGGGGRGGRGGRGGKGGRRKAAAAGRGGGGDEALQLATVLNRNSGALYDEAFANAYHEAKKELDKADAKKQRLEALREHSKLVPRWSDLPEQDHAWYLQHQGQQLVGGDAERMALLRPRVQAEQQAYWHHQEQVGKTARMAARYQHCSDRQLVQLESDAAARRRRVERQLSRCWRWREVHPVWGQPGQPGAAAPPPPGQAPALQHRGTLRREGRPPLFAAPAAGTTFPGSRHYLPCAVEGPAAGSAAAASSTGAAGDVYRKQAVPPLSQDPVLLQLAREQQQQQQQQQPAASAEGDAAAAAAAAAGTGAAGQPLFCLAAAAVEAIVGTPMQRRRPGWEIPVTILPAAADAAAAAEGGAASAGASGGGNGSGSRKLVCLEKPLQPRLLPLRAKQQRLHKYAVLSLGVQQQPDAQLQQQQQQQEQGAPQRRRTRGSTAAEAAAVGAEEAPGAAGAAAGPALPPREAAYDSWDLGGTPLIVRSHGRMQQQQPAATEAQQQQQPAAAEAQQQQQLAAAEAQQQQQQPAAEAQQQEQQHVLLALKTEYLPEPDVETWTLEELYSWWLKLLLRPGADALVAHAHVPHGRLMSCETLSAADIERECGGGAAVHDLAAGGLALLRCLLGLLGRQPPGSYLLTHAPGEDTCLLFQALPAGLADSLQGEVPPLPCSYTAVQPDAIYDLHAAHERSGATDPGAVDYLPPRWRPFQPDIPQIPYTFPPRLSLAKMGRQHRAKKRQRGQLPYAWGVLGEGGDFDQVQHVAQISRADYLAGLEDELP